MLLSECFRMQAAAHLGLVELLHGDAGAALLPGSFHCLPGLLRQFLCCGTGTFLSSCACAGCGVMQEHGHSRGLCAAKPVACSVPLGCVATLDDCSRRLGDC